ncbi:MAG: BamA/TamA family outer membrane protein [Silicimonas sp.]|nr:BamA/TamA family outer membrane protein [Silicimonas sp.]
MLRLLPPGSACRAVLFGAVLTFSTAAWAAPQIRFSAPGAGEDLSAALSGASLVLQSQREGETDPTALLAAAQADYPRLLAVLYEAGHFAPVIRITLNGREAAGYSALAKLPEVRSIAVQVTSGPAYRFGAARVAPLAPGSTPPAGFRPGAVASTTAIREAAASAITEWRDIGHAKAGVADQTITARHTARAVDARLTLAPGPRLDFGPATVEGNKDVRTARILKIAGLREGQRFDPEELEKAATRLRRTGSFRSVIIEEAHQIGPNNTLPLAIGVSEATPRRFGFGAEYSTVEGVRLSGFWLHRNLLGGAERFRVDGSIAGIGGETGGTDLSFGLRYERPATPSADTDFFAELQIEALDEPSFTADTSEFTFGLTRYASDRTTVSLGFGYLYSDTTDANGRTQIELLTLPFKGTHDRRDNALDAREGFFADLEITPFAALEGTSDGAQLTFDARAYRSTERLTFAGRAQIGALFGPSLSTSPAFYRFYSGGGGTVRGQDYQSLGVTTGRGTTGGRSLLALSGEIRADVGESLQLVGFYDWGQVSASSFPDGSGESHSGAGIGLRYKTGLGPIRLDLAAPVSGNTPASDFYIYVGIGQSF